MNPTASAARRGLIALAAGSGLTLGVALAQVQAPAAAQAPAATAAEPKPRLTVREIADRVEAAGYRDITEIELDGSHYEVKARDAQGARIKLVVNAGSGEIERPRR